MKQLNLYPYYENLIQSKTKTTTIRLGDRTNKYEVGDVVVITVGWDEKEAKEIAQASIMNVKMKKINELNDLDLNGESPDCVFKDSVKYVMSSIYKTIVNDDDYVTIIKWRYNGE